MAASIRLNLAKRCLFPGQFCSLRNAGPMRGLKMNCSNSSPTLCIRSVSTIRQTGPHGQQYFLRGSFFALLAAVSASLIWYNSTNPMSITQNQSAAPVAKVANLLGNANLQKDLSAVTDSDPMRLRMEAFVKSSQKQIIKALESLEPKGRFRIDSWTRPEGGDGISAVLQDGKVFEKAGVMVSVVHGKLGPAAVEKMRADHSKIQASPTGQTPFFACGLSLVLHPVNPHAPTVHMNYRYFEIMNADGTQTSWFGGGTGVILNEYTNLDLTPSYLYNEDAIHFHKTLKETCDRHDKRYYPDFKKWCDKYFFVEHRKEARGIGGIFFDDLDDKDQNEVFSFVKDACSSFLPCYLPIIQKRKDMPYTLQEKNWQQIRRGRYVEFNLVLDRGTQFGLRTPGARIESILMSLPLTARWEYMHSVEPDSKEGRLIQVLQQPREWV